MGKEPAGWAAFVLGSYRKATAKSNMFIEIQLNGLTRCIFSIRISMNKYSFNKEG